MYADTLLSIHRIANLFEAGYDTIHSTVREGEAALESGFSLVWERIRHTIDGPTQIDETGQKCSGYKGQTPPWTDIRRFDTLRRIHCFCPTAHDGTISAGPAPPFPGDHAIRSR